MTAPEDISIKRNSDGTYNFYALIRSQYTENNKQIKSLVGLKSDNLKYNKDVDFSIELSSNCVSAFSCAGSKLIDFITERQILYNLKFSKTADILYEFQILNKGDGIMDYSIFEELEQYVALINVAGFTKEELDITFENKIIKVKANPIGKFMGENSDCIINNFDKNKSECELYMPNAETVHASLADGVLCLIIPKASRGVKIEIM